MTQDSRPPRVTPLEHHALADLPADLLAAFGGLDLLDEEPGAPLRSAGRAAQGQKPWNAFSVQARAEGPCRDWLALVSSLMSGALPPRLRELAVLRVAAIRRNLTVRGFHHRIGLKVGLSAAEIARVAVGSTAPGWRPAEADVLAATEEMVTTGGVSDGRFEALRSHLTEEQLVELPMLVGLFVANCTFLEVLRIPTEPGLPPLPVAAG